MALFGTICLVDKLCIPRKNRTGGGRWVHMAMALFVAGNHLYMFLIGRFEQAVESARGTGVTSTKIFHSKQSVYSMHTIMHADTLLLWYMK